MTPPHKDKELERFLFRSDVDARLLNLYPRLREFTFPLSQDEVFTFIRAAYGQGYIDATQEEDAGERGSLYSENGRRIPERRKGRLGS